MNARSGGDVADGVAGLDVEDLLRRHGSELLAVARRHSMTASDAEDALQSGVEKLLTRPPDRARDEVLPWLVTVVKNEARMNMRRQRTGDSTIKSGLVDAAASVADDPADIAIERLEASQGREALLRISPDQARCLLLKADGLSYHEIADVTGFSYDKVHRSLFSGRRLLRGYLDRMESGAECRRVAPMLSMYVDGELRAPDLDDLRSHLANCAGCRVSMRDFADAPSAAKALFPLGVSIGAYDAGPMARAIDHAQSIFGWIGDKLIGALPSSPAAEVALGKKLALASAAAGTIVAGGVGIQAMTGHDLPRVPSAGQAAAAISYESLLGVNGESRTPHAAKRLRVRRRAKPAKARAATAADLISAPSVRRDDGPRRAADEASAKRVFDTDPGDPTGESDPPDDEVGLEPTSENASQ